MTPTWVAASLTNDLFSFQKEYEDAKKIGQPYIVNAVWVLMTEKNIGEGEAKLECRERIKREITKANENADRVKKMEVSEDLKKYLDVLRYSLSGNVVWSLQCPRYHKNIPYNELQNQRAKHGIAKFPARWPSNPVGDDDEGPSKKRARLNGMGIPNGVKEVNGVNGTRKTGDQPKSDYFSIEIPQNMTNALLSPWIPRNSSKYVEQQDFSEANGNMDVRDLVVNTKLAELGDTVSVALPNCFPSLVLELTRFPYAQIVEEPFTYISSLPSKGVREIIINAINGWLDLPVEPLTTIKKVIQRLHNASLM